MTITSPASTRAKSQRPWWVDNDGRATRSWRGPVTCWWTWADGERCGEVLVEDDGVLVCPDGHPIRTRPPKWLDRLIDASQGTPALLERYFEPRGDRG